MSGIKDYSTTPASNTALFPEGMAPSAVNDGMRQVQADLRSWYNDSQWVIYGDGDGAFAIAYASPTSFAVTGADVTAVYHPGRRVRASGALTGTIYGTIQSSAFATNTTVSVTWDSGTLQNEALTIAIGILSSTNSAIPPAVVGAPGAVQLATQGETEAGALTTKAVTPGGLALAAMTWTGTHVFQSADAGTGEVVAIDLDRASASPAPNDLLMALRWKMRDSGAGVDIAAKLVAKLLDPTAASEDAELHAFTVVAGALAARLVVGAGIYTPNATGGDKGSDTVNAQGIYQNGVPHAASDVSIQSGTTHSPTLADHGKTFIYTNAAGCTVTLPAASGLFAGWSIGLQNASGGAVTVNRSSTDVMVSQNTSLTSMQLPSAGDGGQLFLDSTGGSAKFYWQGKRSFEGAEIATTTGTATAQAHGLGVLPRRIGLWLRNKTAEKNYSVGDELSVGWAADMAGAQKGGMIVADATNVTCLSNSTAVIAVLDKSNPATWSAITGANWRYVMRAEAIN